MSAPVAGRPMSAAEDGFTMIELVMAMFIAIIVVGASALIFANANDSSLASQRQYNLGSVLEQQMERIRDVVDADGFSALALTATPTAASAPSSASTPASPDAFVTGSGCSATFTVHANYNSTGETFVSGSSLGDNPEPLVVNGCTVAGTAISGGQLAPVQYVDLSTGALYATQSLVPSGDASATLYSFVTQTSAAGCGSTTANACGADVRRVVLAAALSSTATDIGAQFPDYMTTVFANPVAGDQSNALTTLELFR